MEVIQNTPPALQLPTSRGLVKIFFLGLITFGIYPLVNLFQDIYRDQHCGLKI